jgi:hypothetical protein
MCVDLQYCWKPCSLLLVVRTVEGADQLVPGRELEVGEILHLERFVFLILGIGIRNGHSRRAFLMVGGFALATVET